MHDQGVEDICEKLLVDRVSQDYFVRKPGCSQADYEPALLPGKYRVVEVNRKPGVMDPVEQSVLKGIVDMGLSAATVKTSKRYLISGDLTNDQLKTVAEKSLANSTIERHLF